MLLSTFKKAERFPQIVPEYNYNNPTIVTNLLQAYLLKEVCP